MTSDVIIVTPLYRSELNEYERLSLQSMFNHLGEYDTALCVPESLDIKPLTDQFHFKRVERFDDSYFQTIYDYNRLMLWEGFYKRFSKHKYILICQSDAYIFSNRLDEWIARDYDYVGAPWISTGSLLGKWIPTIKKGINEFIHSEPLKIYPIDRRGNVGNGGFSLRKVEKHIEVCQKLASQINYALQNPEKGLFNEDLIFSIIPERFGITIKKPSAAEALGFAFDIKPDICLKQSGGTLPMAAHGWFANKKRLCFWNAFIPATLQ